MLLDLQSHLKPFCEKYALHCASIEKTEEDNVIIAICSQTPKKIQNHDNEENLRNANNGNFSVPQGVQTLNVESYTNQPQVISELHSQSVRQCQEGLKAVFDDLVSKVECEPHTFLRPINEFIHNYQNTKKDELVSALKTFSQCSEIAMAVKRSLKCQQSGEGVKDEPTTIICPKKRKGNRRKLIRGRPLLQAATQELNNDFDAELPGLQIVTEDVASHDLSHHEISDISGHGISVVHDVTAHTASHPDLRLHPAHLTICSDQQRRM